MILSDLMILSDYDLDNIIRAKRLVIDPFEKDTIRENGVDLRLSDEIAVRNPKLIKEMVFDPTNEEHVKNEYVLKKGKELVVPAHSMVLMSTKEYISMPNNIMGFVEIRSTWARHGLSMPPTIIDAGFKGTITLEVINNAPHAILLKPDMRFAHVIFATTLNEVTNAYKGSYLGQRGIKFPKPIKE